MRALVFLFLLPMVFNSPIQPDEVQVGTEEDAEVLKALVKDLFTDREEREISSDVELGDAIANADTVTVTEDKAIETLAKEEDPAEIARFNNYMDAIFRRMNAALRAKLMDPMIINLNEKTKSKQNKKNHKVEKRSVEEEEEDVDTTKTVEETEEGEGRKLSKKDKKEKKKDKKGGATDAEKKERKKKNEGKKKERRAKKGKKGNKKKADKKEKGDKKKKDGGKKGKGNKGKKGHHEDLARTTRNNQSHDKKKGKSGKKGKEKEGKSMGSLGGIATLRRSGDVSVLNSDTHKTVKSEFTIGPLELEVSKVVGQGKSRSVKTAKAVTNQLKGKMVLKVKPDGSAHVKSVFFQKPEKVDVYGSLGAQKKRSNTYLKNSVSKLRPLAAQRILKMARYVLKSPSSVERS